MPILPTPKIVRTTAKVISFVSKIEKNAGYSERCPYTCHRQQFEELSVHLLRSAVLSTVFIVAQTAKVGRFTDNFSNCRMWPVYPSVMVDKSVCIYPIHYMTIYPVRLVYCQIVSIDVKRTVASVSSVTRGVTVCTFATDFSRDRLKAPM